MTNRPASRSTNASSQVATVVPISSRGMSAGLPTVSTHSSTSPTGTRVSIPMRPRETAELIGPATAVEEAVEEAAEDAAFAGERGRLRGGGPLTGDGLFVVGAGDGVDDLGFVEVLGAIQLGHVADQHAVLHDLGFEPGGAVGVPLGVASARQRDPHSVLTGAGPEQVGVDAAVTQLVDHPAGPEFVHAVNLANLPEQWLKVGSARRRDSGRGAFAGVKPRGHPGVRGGQYCP